MPELPEVETIKLDLQKYLVGHKILSVEILSSKTFQGEVKNIVGATVVEIERAGKGLIIELNNNYVLAIHLKLTGQIIYKGKKTGDIRLSKKIGGSLPSGFTRAIFKLDEEAQLFFNDLRKFGWIKVVKKDEVRNLPFFKEMGPEPPVIVRSKIIHSTSSGQKSKTQIKNINREELTFDKFREIVAKTITPIKIVLMDQKKIGGIGNIYSNEALFLAGIGPKRVSKSLNEKETETLYEAIIEVLKRGLKYGGSSDVNFVNALGEDGKYQNHFLVYGRKGEKCFNCKGFIEKTVLGGRGTYFCKSCQK